MSGSQPRQSEASVVERAQTEILRLLDDGRPWTKRALQHAAGFSETTIDGAVRGLVGRYGVVSVHGRCECCGHMLVRYRKGPIRP